MNNKQIILHLSLIKGIGPSSIAKIVSYCSTKNLALSATYHFKLEDFQCAGLSVEKSALIVKNLKDNTLLENELILLEQHNIEYVTIIDQGYPELLSQIYAPPAILYYQGHNINNAHLSALAVVGSRACSSYGTQVLTQLLPPCIERGIVIASGGALGIDTIAHQTAVQHNGKTIVVLGSGLLKPYPVSNKKLFSKIVESNGLIISSFPLQTEPVATNFPARNRIIAGLASTTLVVQAAEKSGALITAHYALEQGRNVAAVPGSIFDLLSVGCNNLIKQGAYLIENPIDLLQLYDINIKNTDVQLTGTEPVVKSMNIDLSKEQQEILDFCKCRERTVDEIMAHLRLSSEKVSQELFNLECLGFLENNFLHWKSI